MWEPNVGIPIDEQTEKYSCLNTNCCVSMISHIKGKFDFLSAFCIVGVIFVIVVLMNVYYMYKKLKGKKTYILRHKKDDMIFGAMTIITMVLSILCFIKVPVGPEGMAVISSSSP
jgi:hypothetical protein